MTKAVEELLPKALLGALIPLAQFVWQQYQHQGLSWRKSALRKTAIELSQQLSVFPKLADSAAAEAARRDLEMELASTVELLAALGATEASPAPKSQDRSVMARWFLLYAPHSIAAWMVHVLFFVNVFFVLAGVMGLLSNLSDPEAGFGFLGIAIFCLPAFGLRALARRLDSRQKQAGLANVPAAVS
jgi:hypothetical protein